jgi:uncharacterized membrane protein
LANPLACWSARLTYVNARLHGKAIIHFNPKEATMWWWNDYYWHGPWMMWPFIMTVLMLAMCIGMMFMMFTMHRRNDPKRTIDLLNESLARGQITEAQYRDFKKILES